jgi:hypothetical protein
MQKSQNGCQRKKKRKEYHLNTYNQSWMVISSGHMETHPHDELFSTLLLANREDMLLVDGGN